MDDTYAYIKPNKYAFEENNKISLLGVLVKRTSNSKLKTSVLRKLTNTDIYMNWNIRAPTDWKIETLKTLIKLAKTLCSNENSLKTEIEHLRRVFVETNGYPRNIVNRVINQKVLLNLETIQENA